MPISPSPNPGSSREGDSQLRCDRDRDRGSLLGDQYCDWVKVPACISSHRWSCAPGLRIPITTPDLYKQGKCSNLSRTIPFALRVFHLVLRVERSSLLGVAAVAIFVTYFVLRRQTRICHITYHRNQDRYLLVPTDPQVNCVCICPAAFDPNGSCWFFSA